MPHREEGIHSKWRPSQGLTTAQEQAGAPPAMRGARPGWACAPHPCPTEQSHRPLLPGLQSANDLPQGKAEEGSQGVRGLGLPRLEVHALPAPAPAGGCPRASATFGGCLRAAQVGVSGCGRCWPWRTPRGRGLYLGRAPVGASLRGEAQSPLTPRRAPVRPIPWGWLTHQ